MAGHIGTIMSDFMADMTQRISESFPARATGGPVAGGQPYIVGERGPELFVPNGSGNIVPNNQINTTNNYTVNLAGGNNAGGDVMASLRLVTALYG
jgi:phage-related minor tail protein